jgi:hypothetical protein
MRRTLTVTALSLLFILVSLSALPSGTLLKEVKAQSKPNTTITAVDYNNVPIQNLGTTSSQYHLDIYNYRWRTHTHTHVQLKVTVSPLTLAFLEMEEVICCLDRTNFRC